MKLLLAYLAGLFSAWWWLRRREPLEIVRRWDLEAADDPEHDLGRT